MSAPDTGGVRIVHATVRSAVVTVGDPTRPIQGWVGGAANQTCVECSRRQGRIIEHPREFHVCPTCQVIHLYKTYHINVNGDGAAIVSPGVFRGLQQAGAFDTVFDGGDAPFRVDAHVPTPPTQILGTDRGRYQELKQRDKIAIWHE